MRLGRSIVERIGLAVQARAEANADLPLGLAPLPDVESFRKVPSLPRRVVRAERVALYVAENGRPLHDQAKVRPQPDGTGWMGEFLENDEVGRPLPPSTVKKLYRRWTFIDYEFEAALNFRNPTAFAAEMAIPALYGEQPAGWRLGKDVPPGDVLRVLAHADDPLPALSKPNVEKRGRVPLDRFEQEWGPFDALACNVPTEQPGVLAGVKRAVGKVLGGAG